jgi:3-oxoacyl-(acyl-carrier-protein) synthase
MRKIVLTGIGMVTPIGIGKEQFWNAVENGYSGIGTLTKFSFTREISCGAIRDLSFDNCINDRRFRRAASISQYTLLASSLAMNDAGKKMIGGYNTALIQGITHGALNYTQAFHGALIKEGVDSISPILFSDSTLNAPASNASIYLGINGPVHTLAGGSDAAIKAIILACQLLDDGIVDRSLVVCAEELNELSLSCYERLGFTPLSEGSGAILIENEETVKGASPYCYIAGSASECNPSNPDIAIDTVISTCLETASLKVQDIDFIMSDYHLPAKAFFNNIPAGSILPLAGNAFAVTVLWHIILSALVIKSSTIPKGVIQNKVMVSNQIKNVMLWTAGKEGTASAIILSKF